MGKRTALVVLAAAGALGLTGAAAPGAPAAGEVRVVAASVLLGPELSPDGKRLAWVDETGEVLVADVEALWGDGAKMTKLGKMADAIRRTRGSWAGGGMHWRPDSKRIAAWQFGEPVRVFDPDGQAPTTKVSERALLLPSTSARGGPHVWLDGATRVPADYYRVPWTKQVYHVSDSGLQLRTKATRGAARTVVSNAGVAAACGPGWRVDRPVWAGDNRWWLVVHNRPRVARRRPGMAPMPVGRPPPDYEAKLVVTDGRELTVAAAWKKRAISFFGYEPSVQIAVAADGARACALFVDYGLSSTPKPPQLGQAKPKVWVVRAALDGGQARVDLDGAAIGRDKWQTTLAPAATQIPQHALVSAAADAAAMTVWSTDERQVTRKGAPGAGRPTDAVSTSYQRGGTATFGFTIGRLVRVDAAAKSISDVSARLTHGLDVPGGASDLGGIPRYAGAHAASGLVVFQVRKHSHPNRPGTGLALVRLPRPAASK